LIEHRADESIDGMPCGGTVDRVGMMNGKLWIVDLKRVDRLYPGFAARDDKSFMSRDQQTSPSSSSTTERMLWKYFWQSRQKNL
jgi:hypothetical protein